MIKTSKKLNKMANKLCAAKYPVNAIFNESLFSNFKKNHQFNISYLGNEIEEGFKLCEKSIKLQKSVYFIKPIKSNYGGAYFIGEEQELLKLMEKCLNEEQYSLIEKNKEYYEKEIKYHQKQLKLLQTKLNKLV